MAWKWNPILETNSIRMSDMALQRRMKNPTDWSANRPNQSFNEMRNWFKSYGALGVNDGTQPGGSGTEVKFSDFHKATILGVSVYGTGETFSGGYSNMDDGCIRVIPHGLSHGDAKGGPIASSGVDISISGGGHTHADRKTTGATGGTKVRVYTSTSSSGNIPSGGKISGKNKYPSFGHNSVSASSAYYGSGSVAPNKNEQWEGTPQNAGTRYNIRITDVATGASIQLDWSPGKTYQRAGNANRTYCVIRGCYDGLNQGDGQTTQGSPSDTLNRATLHLKFKNTLTGAYSYYPIKDANNYIQWGGGGWSETYHFWTGPSDPNQDRHVSEESSATGYTTSYGYHGGLIQNMGENPNR